MKKNELRKLDDKFVSNYTIGRMLLVQLFLCFFINQNSIAQDVTVKLPEGNQNNSFSDSLKVVYADSIKIVEAKRIYIIPIQNLEDKKLITVPNQQVTKPK